MTTKNCDEKNINCILCKNVEILHNIAKEARKNTCETKTTETANKTGKDGDIYFPDNDNNKVIKRLKNIFGTIDNSDKVDVLSNYECNNKEHKDNILQYKEYLDKLARQDKIYKRLGELVKGAESLGTHIVYPKSKKYCTMEGGSGGIVPKLDTQTHNENTEQNISPRNPHIG